MKELTIKTGTRAEILDYLYSKIKQTITTTNPSSWKYPPEGDVYQFSHNTVEKQIDDVILSGSPLVRISLKSGVATHYRDTFIVSDYSAVRTNVEIERMDNMDLRQQRIDAIKTVMKMDIAAEERWDRILKIIDEFRGQTISL